MFEAIERGEIKALWVMATNPAVSLPRAGAVREALEQARAVRRLRERALERHRERGRACAAARRRLGREGRHGHQFRAPHLAPARVPAAAGRSAGPTGGSSREVARRMGFGEAFAYRSAADIFREHAALSAFENDGARDFDLGGARGDLATRTTTRSSRCNGRCARRRGDRRARFFADGGFFTPDRKARFVAPEPPALRGSDVSSEFPFRLNTGRMRDQWHTMTRTGLSPRLGAHLPEPFVEVHPHDAARDGPRRRRLRRVATAHGACMLKVVVSDGQQPRLAVRADPLERRDRLVARASAIWSRRTPILIPASPRPRRRRPPIAPVAFALSRLRADAPRRSRCRTEPGGRASRVAGGIGYLLATNDGPMVWHDLAPRALAGDAMLAEYVDSTRGIYRAAAFVDGELDGCAVRRPGRRAAAMGRREALSRDDGRRATPHASRPIADRRDRAGDLRLLRRRRSTRSARRSRRGTARTSRRSARRCAPAPIAASCLPELKTSIDRAMNAVDARQSEARAAAHGAAGAAAGVLRARRQARRGRGRQRGRGLEGRVAVGGRRRGRRLCRRSRATELLR